MTPSSRGDRDRSVVATGGWTTALIGAVVAAVLLVLAARSDLADPYAARHEIVLDLVVGLAYLAAGAGLRSGPVERALVAAVGLGWLVASPVPALGGLHQGLLLLALAACAGLGRRGLGMTALPAACLAWGTWLEPVVGATYVGLACGLLLLSRGPAVRRRTAAGCALLVGGWLLFDDWVARLARTRYEPASALSVYEVVLVAVAVALWLASRWRRHTADQVVDAGAGGIAGLEPVLARTLRDPSLRVLPGAAHAGNGAQVLVVEDGGRPVAHLVHRAPALADPGTAASVAQAVRLTVRHEELRAAQQRQVDDLVAARARLVAATDRQRSIAATQLREDVAALAAVHRTVAELAGSPTAAAPASVALAELAAAGDEILGLVAGTPPVPLGDGRLGEALRELARRAPLPVEVRTDEAARASRSAESTAYFVCVEALTNAVKHAGARRVTVDLRCADRTLVVAVSDDGSGGADRSGRGLRGLADRVEAVGGRLRLESPVGAGTTVTASLPVS